MVFNWCIIDVILSFLPFITSDLNRFEIFYDKNDITNFIILVWKILPIIK